jgi:hypothetical protein
LSDARTASKTPFTSINTNYIKNTSGKADCFLNNTEPVENPEDEQRVDHYLTITLLPHQIIIFPTSILDNMDSSVLENMRFYENTELR